MRRPLFEAVAASAAAEAKLVESWSGPEVLARVTEFVERTISRKTP